MSKHFRTTGWNDNLNLIIFFSLVLSGIGITWLSLNEVPAGVRYTTLFLVSIAFLVLSFFFIKEDNRESIKTLIKNPFTTDYHVATGLYVLGWLVPPLVTLILKIAGIKKFVISNMMIPLATGQIIDEIAQSFTVAEAQSSPFWQWFITVFTAGSVEEFVFGFVLMLVGVIIGMLLWRLATNTPANSTGAKWFYIIFALIFSSTLFALMHKLNSSYVGYMFLVAVIFRLFMNMGIHLWGVFISFTLGYHQSNNAVWYFTKFGMDATMKALLSPGGIIILIFFGLILYFVLRNIDQVLSKTKQVLTGR